MQQGKAIHVQAWTGPEGSRRLRLPDFKTFGTWRWDGSQPYAPAAFTHQEIPLVFISVRDGVDTRATVRPEGLCHWKIVITPLGMKHVTSRIVAGRIMSLKNCNDTIRNRTIDLLGCSVVLYIYKPA